MLKEITIKEKLKKAKKQITQIELPFNKEVLIAVIIDTTDEKSVFGIKELANYLEGTLNHQLETMTARQLEKYREDLKVLNKVTNDILILASRINK